MVLIDFNEALRFRRAVQDSNVVKARRGQTGVVHEMMPSPM